MDGSVFAPAALREYLAAVYPAARTRIEQQLTHKELVDFFESLDYYYSSSNASRALTLPAAEEAATHLMQPLPYLPSGAYYRALGQAPLDRGRFNAILWGSFDRHIQPVHVVNEPLLQDQVPGFHSSFGARMGPQPSWTSPFAIVRYVHYPNGLEPRPPSRPLKAQASSTSSFFQLQHAANQSDPASISTLMRSQRSIARLLRLKHGATVEIEQWGGLLGIDECPPICGLWANIWRGTGVMLRVSHPFVSLNKATAVVEMTKSLDARNASALHELITVLGANAGVRAKQSKHPGAPLWACLCAYMLAQIPCAGVAKRGAIVDIAQQWADMASRSTPEAIADWVLHLGTSSDLFSPAARFALYWTLGICGKGQKSTPFWAAAPVGPDGLLTALACILGHRTIVLAASANDNGLLHQELVDYDLPEPLAWPTATNATTNDVRKCVLQPFAFIKADGRRGNVAAMLRRRQMFDFWESTGKFVLPTDPSGDADHQVVPCGLGFGRTGGPGAVRSCVGPKTRVSRPSADKACWAWCNGTASHKVLAAAALGHVRMSVGPQTVRGSRRRSFRIARG